MERKEREGRDFDGSDEAVFDGDRMQELRLNRSCEKVCSTVRWSEWATKHKGLTVERLWITA